MNFKSGSLIILCLFNPIFSFAEGQAGLEGSFYALFILSFSIQTIVGGKLISSALRKRGIIFGLLPSMAISFALAWALFAFDRLMFLFPLSLIYLMIMFLVYLLIPSKRNI